MVNEIFSSADNSIQLFQFISVENVKLSRKNELLRLMSVISRHFQAKKDTSFSVILNIRRRVNLEACLLYIKRHIFCLLYLIRQKFYLLYLIGQIFCLLYLIRQIFFEKIILVNILFKLQWCGAKCSKYLIGPFSDIFHKPTTLTFSSEQILIRFAVILQSSGMDASIIWQTFSVEDIYNGLILKNRIILKNIKSDYRWLAFSFHSSRWYAIVLGHDISIFFAQVKTNPAMSPFVLSLCVSISQSLMACVAFSCFSPQSLNTGSHAP